MNSDQNWMMNSFQKDSVSQPREQHALPKQFLSCSHQHQIFPISHKDKV
jgi:hypothetical protein